MQISPGSSSMLRNAAFFVGLGMLWTWISLSFFSLTLFNTFENPIRSVELANCIALATSAVFTCLVFLIPQDRSQKVIISRSFLVFFGLIGSVGTALMTFSRNSSLQLIIGAVLLGISRFALFYLSCSRIAYCRISGSNISMIFSFAILISAFSALLVLPAGAAVSSALCIILPFIGALLIAIPNITKDKTMQGTSRKTKTQFADKQVKKEPKSHAEKHKASISSVPWKLILGLSLFGVVFGMMQLSVDTGDTDGYAINHILHMLARGGAALVTLLAVVVLKRGYWFLSTIGAVCFLVGLVSYSAPMYPLDFLSVFFITFGFTSIELLIWIILFDFYQETQLSWNTSYALIRGASGIALSIGAVFTFLWGESLGDSTKNIITLALIAGMVLASITVFSFKDIATLWNQPKERVFTELPGHTDASKSLSESFGLSPREVEVALLLIRGRSEPYISEALFITNHTTHSHVNKIYKKMNVHSRQEFLDVIENVLKV